MGMMVWMNTENKSQANYSRASRNSIVSFDNFHLYRGRSDGLPSSATTSLFHDPEISLNYPSPMYAL